MPSHGAAWTRLVYTDFLEGRLDEVTFATWRMANLTSRLEFDDLRIRLWIGLLRWQDLPMDLRADLAASGAALAESAKNRHEHQLVVDALATALEPLCTDLQIAEQPQLSKTAAVWHLYTPISGRLRERSTTALDLAVALHPTPAVGGSPTEPATTLIRELEGDRGFYAGAVGWCDQRGDGRWVVSIRCAQLSADRRSALAHSGGGIVAESDPDDEVAETTTKFRTILSALGVTP